MVEHLAYIEKVAGSSPVPPIVFGTIAQLVPLNTKKALHIISGLLAELVDALVLGTSIL